LVAVERGEEAFLDHAPHPLHGLRTALLLELARRDPGVTELRDGVPDLAEPAALERRAGEHRRLAALGRAPHEPERRGELALREHGAALVVAVGLVDGEDVGHLEDAAFDALEL